MTKFYRLPKTRSDEWYGTTSFITEKALELTKSEDWNNLVKSFKIVNFIVHENTNAYRVFCLPEEADDLYRKERTKLEFSIRAEFETKARELHNKTFQRVKENTENSDLTELIKRL